MANVTDVATLYNGRRKKVFRLQGAIDTAESDVTKITIGNFTTAVGATATYSIIDRIDYVISQNGYVLLEWDHTTDDEIAILTGQGFIDWRDKGGFVDPKTTGGTGNILLSTVGLTAAISATNIVSYDITITLRTKA